MRILTFLSCVGMIMNGDYISFKELGELLTNMKVPEVELQWLQLQSFSS